MDHLQLGGRGGVGGGGGVHEGVGYLREKDGQRFVPLPSCLTYISLVIIEEGGVP